MADSNVVGEGEAFGGEVQTDVIDEWATLATAEARRDRLVELVNQRLATAGVPPVTPIFDTNPNNAGSFGFARWVMRIGRARLDGDSISEEDAREIADTVYHEARHTEQWFRMAQLRAGQGLGVAAMVTELGIEARIARLARAEPLVRGSMEAVIAQGWWDSVYGSGSAHRESVLTEVNRAATERTAAQNGLRRQRDGRQSDAARSCQRALRPSLRGISEPSRGERRVGNGSGGGRGDH